MLTSTHAYSSMLAACEEYYPMPRSTQKIVAAYVRISDPNREGESEIQSQKHACREYSEKNNLYLPEEYLFEEAVSAYNLPYKRRPELMRLLQAAKRGEFQAVIVVKLSRLARTSAEMQLIIGILEIDYGIEVISVTDPVYQTKQEKSIARALHGIVAELEHDNIVESTTRGKLDRVRLGQRLLGTANPCFGFTWKDKTRSAYVHNTEIYCTDVDGVSWSEYEVAKYILTNIRDGWPIRRMMKYLNSKGIPTRRGCKWHKGAIYQMATNPAYYGKAIAFRWQRKDGKKSMKLRDESETILLPEGTIEPIITEEDFNLIQRQFEFNKLNAQRNSKHPEVGLMRSLVTCGICHRSCQVSHPTIRGHVRYSYQCRYADQREKHTAPTVSIHLVDEEAWKLAVSYIKDPDLLMDQVRGIVEKSTDEVHIERLKSDLEKVKEQLAKLVEFALDATDKDMMDMLREKRKKLEKDKRNIERLLEMEEGDIEQERAIQQEIDKFIAWCDTVRPFIDDSEYHPTYDEKRKAILILGIRAIIYPSDHETRFELTTSPKGIVELLVEFGYLSISTLPIACTSWNMP
jgi:site-specific DNA recombinase